MAVVAMLWDYVTAGEFGALELLALGLGAGALAALIVRRPSRESVFYFAGMACLIAALLILLRQNFTSVYEARLIEPTHYLIGTLFQWSGFDITIGPRSLATDTFAIRLASGCSGVSFVSVLLAMILLYPAPLRAKVLGVSLGLVTAIVLNVTRFGALLWIGSRYPSAFPHAKDLHAFVFVACLLGLWAGWLLWVDRMRPAEARGNESTTPNLVGS